MKTSIYNVKAKTPKKGLKSSKVINKITFPQKNVMVIERTYVYPPKDANINEENARKRVYLPKDTRDGWLWMFTSKDDYIDIEENGGGVWVVREYYVKEGYVYQYPKSRKETKNSEEESAESDE